ncbi:hypothetical protein HU200_040069 [Digitaria exilis]|uniref:starch synthase n=1 Tax=Digitaria exilis TaxID=1010633 RepID=A0A835EET9_9POAL|nr:hypothetical protein HU200_040069 [Digitaria exilis]
MLIALLQMYSPPNFLLRCSTSSGVGLILIEPTQLSYFNRDMLRGYPDDFEREKIMVSSHGLDGEFWDPSKDIYLPRRYSANDLEGKSICREALKRRLGFHSGSSIIVGCIFDGYSDIHNLKEAVHVALRRSAQVIFMEKLGSVVNSSVLALKEEFINLDDNIAFIEEYDETLAHLIYAGSDIILCSSFEDPSLQIAKNDPSSWDQQIKDGMVKGLAWDAECYDLHWEAYSSIRKL